MEQNKQAAESRETLLSMQELEPLPVKDTPIQLDHKGEYFPDSKSTSASDPPSRSSSLGLSGHNTVWWLNRIQRYSSYTFTAFAAMHITNTSIIPLLTRSVPAADTYLLLTRPYYQSTLMEPLLVIGPLLLHIGSGIALRIHRRRQSVKWYGAEDRKDRRKLAWPPVSLTSASGFALAWLVAGHSFVNRALPVQVEGNSSGVGLQYVAHGFAKHPAVAYTGYAVLVGVASAHLVWGWSKWLGLTPATAGGADQVQRGLRQKRRRYGVNGLVAVVALLWATGGLGVVGKGGAMRGWMGKAYDELYSKIPIVGRWM